MSAHPTITLTLTFPPGSCMSGAKEWYAHPSAVIDEPANIGSRTRIWHFCHVMADCSIGEDCNLGQNVFVGSGVRIGSRVKIQNNVSLYSGTIVEDGVFLGPSCVLTNVTNPRSEVSRHTLYEPIVIRRGATIGANATIVCGVSIGRHAFVAAGAVVTHDIADYALVMGVPAKQVGWMSRHGHRLGLTEGDVQACPESGYRYELRNGRVRCLDLDEDAPLPTDKAVGTRAYGQFKTGVPE
jgi:UDP-2-acetamido-3-amino-2,3-dideoxy-glucuronate N-acetyltransferase